MLKSIFNLRDSVMSVFVIMVVALIIIPLPTFFLDFAFVTNIAISLMILLISIYIKDALEFSVFPSLLLITTLFRLGLNISSTRQILTNGGNAGQVVSTFGNFVLQGNVVVGFIIFIIIRIVTIRINNLTISIDNSRNIINRTHSSFYFK